MPCQRNVCVILKRILFPLLLELFHAGFLADDKVACKLIGIPAIHIQVSTNGKHHRARKIYQQILHGINDANIQLTSLYCCQRISICVVENGVGDVIHTHDDINKDVSFHGFTEGFAQLTHPCNFHFSTTSIIMRFVDHIQSTGSVICSVRNSVHRKLTFVEEACPLMICVSIHSKQALVSESTAIE